LQHVFVETNWLVECLAPAHHKEPAALELLEKAKSREVILYLPAICLAECQRPIREKFQAKPAADRVRKFLLWAKSNGTIEPGQEETVRRTLVQMESLVKRDLDRLADALADLCSQSGLEVFHLNEEMLVRSTELSFLGLQLQPFDQAILASILVKAEMLQQQGVVGCAFCEADSDLQPWDKTGELKEPLVRLYGQAAIWVYGDFRLQRPEIPQNWPKKVENPKEGI
jgi:predicted nucleic acid-binding protein